MSLLDVYSAECQKIDRTSVPDGSGGQTDTWTNGVMFHAAIALDNSTEEKTALADGTANNYTVVTPRSFVLKFHDVFKRLSDGKTFRVITDGTDKHTPSSAYLDMSVVTAEEWKVTDE